jgi:hypothetical protein
MAAVIVGWLIGGLPGLAGVSIGWVVVSILTAMLVLLLIPSWFPGMFSQAALIGRRPTRRSVHLPARGRWLRYGFAVADAMAHRYRFGLYHTVLGIGLIVVLVSPLLSAATWLQVTGETTYARTVDTTVIRLPKKGVGDSVYVECALVREDGTPIAGRLTLIDTTECPARIWVTYDPTGVVDPKELDGNGLVALQLVTFGVLAALSVAAAWPQRPVAAVAAPRRPTPRRTRRERWLPRAARQERGPSPAVPPGAPSRRRSTRPE